MPVPPTSFALLLVLINSITTNNKSKYNLYVCVKCSEREIVECCQLKVKVEWMCANCINNCQTSQQYCFNACAICYKIESCQLKTKRWYIKSFINCENKEKHIYSKWGTKCSLRCDTTHLLWGMKNAQVIKRIQNESIAKELSMSEKLCEMRLIKYVIGNAHDSECTKAEQKMNLVVNLTIKTESKLIIPEGIQVKKWTNLR